MLKYFSTFTGIGGLDMGLADWCECVGFSDIKESSIGIYKSHYPEHKNFGDITKINYKELPDFDILTGGFPCQSFSILGAREGFKNRKGQMIFYLYDLIVEKKPKFIVLENVKGLLTHNNGSTYINVVKLLSMAGYYVRVLLLNSLNYGSAQNRERLIFLCSLNDFAIKIPEIVENKKLFRDIRDNSGNYKYVSEKAMQKLVEEKGFNLIGGYDRVNTLTTGYSSSGRDKIVVQELDGRFRYLTPLEGERLQGFPEGWTEGQSLANRFFALGNAVNCNISNYLFKNYLKGLWW